MAKPLAKTTQEIMDQINKARQALEYFTNPVVDGRGEFNDGTEVRNRLNAAKAHVIRAIEKSQALR